MFGLTAANQVLSDVMEEIFHLNTLESAVLDYLYIDETAELVTTGIGGIKVRQRYKHYELKNCDAHPPRTFVLLPFQDML